MALDDRPRGILSQADREYLRNPDEYSKQAGYERRRAIIERVQEALHDMPLLVSELDEDSRAEAFEDEADGTPHTLSALSSAFALFYLGITDTVEPTELAKDAFEDITESGVRKAYLQRGVSVEEVEVEVSVTRGERVDDLREKEELSYPEVNQLLEAGELSDLTGEEQMALLNEALESGREAKVGAFPALNTSLREDEGDDEDES